ncbi:MULTISPECIES: hypothetical protein [Pseudomonas aeruginosa group]|uniref:hypothetical protein n=1 Tax=Pseudomonas aeruginosa group TaxID=136841 RepID=UPI0005BB8419|nr:MULTISPECIES: hypothetical protein [Pseudomonas aeruginosa group]VTS25966.1 Uncharacterised protein [Streptococcus dysgalactiae subsp. equisimilis]KRU84917.1 hypothetical protein AN454_23750 [Pseudomonas aeruginosa]MBG3902426.1 hypothetical protein [Pseudomonas aeruginosa]MBG4201278.1 hypothetical protein [Pseudomonas aeruginosa]MBG4279641.1 hypothetical protein [Pseudomonas aeruginosa]
MSRPFRLTRFILPLLLSLCQPSFAAELRAVPEARRQELLLAASTASCGEADCPTPERVSLLALQVETRIFVTRLALEDFSPVSRQPAELPDFRLFGDLGLAASPFAWQASTGERAATDALRF